MSLKPPKKHTKKAPITFQGISIKEHFGKSIDLSRALDEFGLRIAWNPDKWALYEIASRLEDYDAVVVGNTLDQLEMFVRGLKHGRAFIFCEEGREE